MDDDHLISATGSLLDTIRLHVLQGPELGFLIDLLKKTIVFSGIFSIAIGINLTAHSLHESSVHWSIIYGLEVSEFLLFWGDIIWFSFYIVVSTSREIFRLYKEYNVQTLMLSIFAIFKRHVS